MRCYFSRTVRYFVVPKLLTSQKMNTEHSSDNIQLCDVITPGGAAL